MQGFYLCVLILKEGNTYKSSVNTHQELKLSLWISSVPRNVQGTNTVILLLCHTLRFLINSTVEAENVIIVDSKIDENRCKQTRASLP